MSARDFLLEIGTEELPPNSLQKLGESLGANLSQGLDQSGLTYEGVKAYAAPRRLAVLISGLLERQPDQAIEKRGPAVQAAFDANGEPTKAAEGFARSNGVTPDALETLSTDKGDYLVYRATQKGEETTALLPGLIDKAVASLPIAKRMRWGAHDYQFVRPVKWVTTLYGEEVLPYRLFGLDSGRVSYGHRIHHPQEVALDSPSHYESALRSAYVMADFSQRVESIRTGLLDIAEQNERVVDIDEGLLEEVAALNEWPVVLAGQFEDAFLAVPEEALVSSMQDHQKYFPVRNLQGELVSEFYFVANLESKDPGAVVQGNERVIRPRLADAAFFWETDRQSALAARLPKLDKVVFQKALGSVGDKARRIEHLAARWSAELGEDTEAAKRSALLAKCDLVTDMVFEFEDLQGIAGYYYARNDGESNAVALAVRDQYRPGFAGDDLPETRLGCLIGLLDRVDTLVGIFGIGQKPTGTRDPFALRRASLAVLRLSIEGGLDLDLRELFRSGFEAYRDQGVRFKEGEDELVESLLDYLFDRLRGYYQERGLGIGAYLSVVALKPLRPVDFEARIRAVADFLETPEADLLTPMNKRLDNILSKASKSEAEPCTLKDIEHFVNDSDVKNEAEQGLLVAMREVYDHAETRANELDYSGLLGVLTHLAQPLDEFFENVMVLSDDPAERQRRLSLLSRIHGWFLRVADFSRLGD